MSTLNEWRQRYDLSPEFLAEFELIAPIGSGAMGEVVKARQRSIDRLVAIKFLARHFYEDEDTIRRFSGEAVSLGRLNHKNIVQVIQFAGQAPSPYIVLEYVDGMGLRTKIRKSGPFSVGEALDVVAQICEGLQQAHDNNIIHRDLKSENVLITEDGVAKIVDFGIAKITEGKGDQTSTGVILGTPEYMSPEQCRGEVVDGRSDIYSAGIILFELLTGRVPFTDTSTIQVLIEHVEMPPPRLQIFAPELPPELDELVRRALAKKVFARHGSAEAFLIAIRGTRRALSRQQLLDVRAEAPAPDLSDAQTLPAGAAAARRDAKLSSKARPSKRQRPARGRPRKLAPLTQAKAKPAEPAAWGGGRFVAIAVLVLLLVVGVTIRVFEAGRVAGRVTAPTGDGTRLAKQLDEKLESILEGTIEDPAAIDYVLRNDIGNLIGDKALGDQARDALRQIMKAGGSSTVSLVVGTKAACLLAETGDTEAFATLLNLYPGLDGLHRTTALEALKKGVRTNKTGGRLSRDKGLCTVVGRLLNEPFDGEYAAAERVTLLQLYVDFAPSKDAIASMVDFARQERFGKTAYASEVEFTKLGAIAGKHMELRRAISAALIKGEGRQDFEQKAPKSLVAYEQSLKRGTR